MNADEIEKAKEIVRTLQDAERNTELDCEINELRPTLTQAADLIESLTAQLTESQRREKADAELIRKIYFATDEDLCDCCRKIVRMIEAWWNDDEKGEAE